MFWFSIFFQVSKLLSVLASDETCQEWLPYDDPKADLFPSRALDTELDCPTPRLLQKEIRLLDFHGTEQDKIFIALNGANVGGIFQSENLVNCLGSLAKFAYETMAPKYWERDGPKFLYSAGGLPIRMVQDIQVRGQQRLHVLNSRQTWVWPAHDIHFRFRVEGVDIETISDKPRVFLLHNLIPNSTCDDIVKEYDKTLEPSPEKHYSDEFRDHRTSETGWMKDSPFRYKMQRILRLPSLTHVEGLQFLKYKPGKWYKHHHDYFHDYTPNHLLLLRRWMKMRLASLIELPLTWKGFTKEESLVEDILLKAATQLKKVISRPRGIPIFHSKNIRQVANYIVFNENMSFRLPMGVLTGICKELKIESRICTERSLKNALGNAYHEHKEDKAYNIVSRIISKAFMQELHLDEDIAITLQYDEFSFVKILETESIDSEIQPNRHATILPYLNDVPTGGETVLPAAKNPELYLGSNFVYPVHAGISECSRGLIIKPKKGAAAMFYHRLPNGDLDELSIHAGCPPKEGTKYAINGFTWNCDSSYGFSFFDN